MRRRGLLCFMHYDAPWCYGIESAQWDNVAKKPLGAMRMPDPDDFVSLIERVRSGDEEACARLVARFEPFMLRVVRFRMRNRSDYDRLRHEVGSVDVCQEVFLSLFERLKGGRFELTRPSDLERLLSAMIRFKIASKARARGVTLRQLLGEDLGLERAGASDGTAKRIEDQDLTEAVLRLVPTEEMEILNRRLDDQTWGMIAAAMGEQPETLRKRLERTFARIRQMMAGDQLSSA